MSVIVKRLKGNTMEVYVKGAPEVMGDICEKDSCMAPSCPPFVKLTTSRTVPQDYDDLLSYYTRAGYRVIAVAGKSIEGLTWLKAQRMKRYGLPDSLRLYDAPSDFPSVNKLKAVFVSLDWSSLRISSNRGQRLRFFR